MIDSLTSSGALARPSGRAPCRGNNEPSLTVGLMPRSLLNVLSAQLLQTLRGQHQRLILLAKTEAYLLRTLRRIAIKTGTRDTGDADFANQVPSELNVVFETKRADVGHDVISAVGRESPETCILKFRQNQIAARFVILLQLIVVGRRQ